MVSASGCPRRVGVPNLSLRLTLDCVTFWKGIRDRRGIERDVDVTSDVYICLTHVRQPHVH